MFWGTEQSVQEVIISLGYVGILWIMFLECVFPPIPSELVLPFAGFLVATGELHFVGVLAASTVGSLAGALVLYAFGKWTSEHLVLNFLKRFGRYIRITEAQYHYVLRQFEQHGIKIILLGRILPILRSLVSIPAGANQMSLPLFFTLTAIGVLVWNAVLIGSGSILGRNWNQIVELMAHYQALTIAVIVLLPVAYIGYRLVKNTGASA